MRRVLGLAAALGLAGAVVSGQRAGDPPDAIFRNGKIATVDTAFTVAEAFAVKGDRFTAVGSNADISALAGPGTQVVDLRGRTVVPGLIDNHNHQYHVALMTQRGVDVSRVTSLKELLDRVRQAVAATPAGRTVYTNTGWDPRELPERRPPTRKELDEVGPTHPVVVYESRSRAYLNSAALKVLGITRETPQPPRITIGKDQAGELDGTIGGSPGGVIALLAKVVPPPDLDETKAIIKKVQAQQHALGLTGIRELQLRPDVMRAYFELWRERGLTMRTSVGLELNAGEEGELEELLGSWGVGSGFGDEWLRLDCVAEFNPGDLVTQPDGRVEGELRLPEEKFREAILVMNRHGWRPAIHINGDKTLDLVLDAYEMADRERSIRDRRWIVEHIPLVRPDQIDRISRLGVLVSAQFQPYAGAERMIRQWGRERAERAVPMRELLDAKLVVSGGSDWPGAPNNPFVNIYFYVTRKTQEGGVIGAAQKISRNEALRVETLANAYMTFEETLKGSIEAGKLADFVILSDDVLTVPEERILEIRPLATYVGGRRVYASPNDGL